MKIMTKEELTSFDPAKVFGHFLISLKHQFINALNNELKKETKNPQIDFIFSATEDDLDLTEDGYLENYDWDNHMDPVQKLYFSIPNHKTAVRLYVHDFAGSNIFSIDLLSDYKFDFETIGYIDKYSFYSKDLKSTEVLFSDECIKICTDWLFYGEIFTEQTIFSRNT